MCLLPHMGMLLERQCLDLLSPFPHRLSIPRSTSTRLHHCTQDALTTSLLLNQTTLSIAYLTETVALDTIEDSLFLDIFSRLRARDTTFFRSSSWFSSHALSSPSPISYVVVVLSILFSSRSTHCVAYSHPQLISVC